mgnify:CR=1 FL=1
MLQDRIAWGPSEKSLVELAAYIPKIEQLRVKLEAGKAPIPSVVATRTFDDGDDKCLVYVVNAFPLGPRLHLMSSAIKSAAKSLLKALIAIDKPFRFALNSGSFMFEPSPNRVI